MKSSVIFVAAFALLVLAGVTWVEVSVSRGLPGFWLARERMRRG
jgi:hypothetical protein